MQQNKRAILVVSFGTSYAHTREKTIDAIENAIARAFPEDMVSRAFTSKIVLRKLRERDRLIIDTVPEALEKLAAEGVETVIVQPTHVLNGEEYDQKIVAEALPFRDRFSALVFGTPLLTSPEDYQALAGILSEKFPPQPDTVVCLMGHGTAHYADAAYATLEYHLRDAGREDILVGTVEGFPDLDTVMKHVKKLAAKRVILAPLMVVAGDHALNDMAGDEDDAWKTIFEREGYTVECVLEGLGQYPAVHEQYINHVRRAIEKIQ